METIWIATGNAHKAEEFQEMFGDQVKVKTLKDLDHEPEIEETGKTFEENALIKARTIHNLIHEAVIADDSGLVVDALDGAPGIYSSRFMGENTSYDIKNQAIIDSVNEKEKEGKSRSAR
ncbi:non-canonical purine NTP pyrophosphatase, partial [Ileibacterium valens]